MATFDYKAKNTLGNLITGRFDAADRMMVASLLRSKGLFPLEIRENVAAGREIKLHTIKRAKARDFAIFCRQFHTMINAGVTVLACLDMLRKQTENRKLSEVTEGVYDEVQKGKSLSEAMKVHGKVFPPILISMTEAGEVSGTLDTVMERLAVHFEKENRMRQKIKSAMTYPAVIGCLALIMVTFMLTFVVPRFVSIFKAFGGELPGPTKVLLKVSGTVTDIWFILGTAAVIGLIAYFFSKFGKTAAGRMIIGTVVLRIPILGKNIRKILASRFSRTLSSMLSTGVPLIQALEVADKVVDNEVVTRALSKVREDIKRGSNLAGPLEGIGIFPSMVTQMINVGEEAGSLDSVMEKVADFYDDEVDMAVSRMISLLEPMMIFFMAAIVGSIVVAMILPVFSMYGSIGK